MVLIKECQNGAFGADYSTYEPRMRSYSIVKYADKYFLNTYYKAVMNI